MPTIKTLICEVREDSNQHHDDSLLDGTTYRILYDDDQIVENTTSPLLATAEALSARGYAPDTLFALRNWDDDKVHCVIPIGHANYGLWA